MYENLTPDTVRLVIDKVRQGGGGGRIVIENGAPRLLPLQVPQPAGDARVPRKEA
jgi:hypothetical protein